MPLYPPPYAAGVDLPLASGDATMAREFATFTSVLTGTQNLRLSFFTATKTETTTQVRIQSGGTAAGATPSLVRVGLYTVASDGAGALVASTANDTALLASTGTSYTKAWSSSYAKVAGQRYALGILVVTAATAPTLVGNVQSIATENALAPRATGLLTGQADLPASFTEAGLVSAGGTSQRPYAVVLP